MEIPTFRSTTTRVPVVGWSVEKARVALPRTSVPPEAARTRRSTMGHVMTAVLVADLGLLGFTFLLQAIVGVNAMINPQADQGGLQGIADDPSLLWLNAFIVLFMMGFVPLAWVLATRARPLPGAVRYLGLHRPARSLFVGTGLAGLLLTGTTLLLLFFAVTGLPVSPREVADEPLPSVFTWPLVIMVSFAAGFGEEILFRGLLQRWLGWVGQAAVFAVAHLGSGEPLQLGVTFAVGLLFGRLRALGWSLWTLVTAHAVYDFCLLALDLVLNS